MRFSRLTVTLLLLLTLTACGINSNVGIPAGEEFRLGENQHGTFSVAVENTGGVSIRVVEERENGERIDLATLEPGAAAQQRFSEGVTAVLVNASDVDAQVKVKITGDTELSMGYAASE